MQETIYFATENDNIPIPTKRDEDGCYDIYAYIADDLVIGPHEIKLVPTGLYSAFSNQYRISLRERGSNSKSGLKVCSGQIDSGYRGQWFVALMNANDIAVRLTYGIDKIAIVNGIKLVPASKAICQAAVEIVPETTTIKISKASLGAIPSKRGTGCLGSSGK